MEDKKMIIIAVAVVAIIAIVGVIFATGMLNSKENIQTTHFEAEFMEGDFVGNVSLVNKSSKFIHSYVDKQHDVTYNISTVDNSTALMEIYEIQGVTNPEHRSFNGNDWNIYFTQAVPGNDSNSTNGTMNIIICQSQAEKQGYMIYAIFGEDSDVNSTGNAFGPTYTDYVEPLLKSVELKKSKNVAKINEEFGLTEEQFAQQMDLIHQYQAGNASALEG